MIDCDLSFENSDVNATVSGEIMSIKNPLQGSKIATDSIGEIIIESSKYGCEIITPSACYL